MATPTLSKFEGPSSTPGTNRKTRADEGGGEEGNWGRQRRGVIKMS